MDNASPHHTDGIYQLCSKAGVKIMYLPTGVTLKPFDEMDPMATLASMSLSKWVDHRPRWLEPLINPYVSPAV